MAGRSRARASSEVRWLFRRSREGDSRGYEANVPAPREAQEAHSRLPEADGDSRGPVGLAIEAPART